MQNLISITLCRGLLQWKHSVRLAEYVPRLRGELLQQKRLIYYNPTGYSDRGGRSVPFSREPFPKVLRIALRLYLRHQLSLIIPLCRFGDKSQFLGEDLQEDSFINAINFSGFRCSRKLIWNRGWKALSNIDEGESQLPIDWWSLPTLTSRLHFNVWNNKNTATFYFNIFKSPAGFMKMWKP